MAELSVHWRTHLEKALEADEPSEKNFHIRQVLQAEHATGDESGSNERGA